jgi:hypothetical protein
MKTITLEVSDDIARRFEATSTANRQAITATIDAMLPEETREEFLRKWDSYAEEAARFQAANGVTEEEIQKMIEELCEED